MTVELQVLLQETMTADAALSALIGPQGVHSLVGTGTLPYIVLGSSGGGENVRFARVGLRGIEMVTGYSRYQDKLEALTMWEHVYRLFHRQKFTTAGGVVIHTRATLLTIDQDPGEGAVARFIGQVRVLGT